MESQPDSQIEEAELMPDEDSTEDQFIDAGLEEGMEVEPFTWQASEYIHHNKGAVWYAAFAGILLLLLGIVIFTKQWLSIAVFAVMGVAIAIYARKTPRTMSYSLTEDGIGIDGRIFSFDQFRAFAVMPDISWHMIDLEPTQRFMPRLTILFEDKDFDSIVGHLSEYLPRVDRQPDFVERLTRYLRF